MKPPDQIAAAVLAEIHRQGKPVSHVAEAASVHRGRLSQWLRGKSQLSSDSVCRVLAYLRLGIRRIK